MKFQKAIITLYANQGVAKNDALISYIDPRCFLTVTILYLFFLLSVPLTQLDRIIWFAIYPIVMAPFTGVSFSKVFIKSLYVLPFILLLGIFNPLLDHREAFEVGHFVVTQGWITFISITIRGLLAVEALLILNNFCGFNKICESLRALHCPKVLVVQLSMLHRYIGVLLEESSKMHSSVMARGYGKSSFPIKLWTHFVGALFFKTMERSKRIHNAMLSRGFDGDFPLSNNMKWTIKDTFFLIVWTIVFTLLHIINMSQIFL